MAAPRNVLFEEQSQCSICLEVFTEPVSIPCGHNFCKKCINKHWDSREQYQCPLCQETFHRRPELGVNTTFRDLVDQNADRERDVSMQCISDLKILIERNQAELIEIEEKQKATVRRAEGIIEELQQEITELQRRSTEIEHLSHTKDHLHLLQKKCFPLQHIAEFITRELGLLRLTNVLQCTRQQHKHTSLSHLLYSTVDVTLDPDTANPILILSEDREVKYGKTRQNLPDNPERFDMICNVLGKEGFSSGRFYFEVQVEGKTLWSLGVARESINRKGQINLNPKFGYWTIWMRNGNEYAALGDITVHLSLRQKPQKVGVFVDYEEGQVSFYDVETSSHIYSFTGFTFTEKLYPFLSPEPDIDGENSSPLVITPVSQID
ncbi:nuclear factor 7, brain-like [Salvelinus fontinalis]|uniref:nuclear factor 7, brain-like n=1 Tax=Salvelinus fontinalis TaxID=8038 RepID=UPI0024868BDC|nr:nuclear factor 7, brain-like [Salvelinus fontinalis]